ncbi:MAG: S1C family serine protease [Thermoplasmata archaeon]
MLPKEVVERTIYSVTSVYSEKLIGGIKKKEEISSGTGFFIDRNIVVTNMHVILDTNNILIKTYEGEEIKPKFIDGDINLDLAFLDLGDVSYIPLLLEDSDLVKIGEYVIAIGNPLGIFSSPTVTFGIISAKNRNAMVNDILFENLLQTDAAINPGNSGGPLLNMEGRVLGITSSMILDAHGIGFAIPSNTIKIAFETLKKNGRLPKLKLGISGISIDESTPKRIRDELNYGVYVIDVKQGSIAEKNGIMKGDIILEFNGNKVYSIEDLRFKLSMALETQKVILTLLRDRKLINIEINI